jgi:hypothetical protein
MHEQPTEDRHRSHGRDISRRSEQLAISTPNKEIDLDGGRLALMSRPSRWPEEIRAEARTATQGMGWWCGEAEGDRVAEGIERFIARVSSYVLLYPCGYIATPFRPRQRS